VDYQRIYNELINHRKIKSPDGYYEKHHIIPKCLGGTDDLNNIVKLSAREHFFAHALLCKIYPTNPKVFYAFRIMSAKNAYQNRIVGHSKIYENLKNKAAIFSSKRLSESTVIYNPESGQVKYINKSQSIPDGWKLGSNKKNNQGKIRYYNKEIDIEILIDPLVDNIPSGYIKGRRPKYKKFNNKSLKIVNVSTGDVKLHLENDIIPDGYVISKASTDRKIKAYHILTKNIALLTLEEYDNHLDWIQCGHLINHLYHTDIGVVRSKDEYIRKSGKSINIKKYCFENDSMITSWLINRSKLPPSWLNRTWKELGFFIVDI